MVCGLQRYSSCNGQVTATQHNEPLATAYVKQCGFYSRYPKVSEQVETLPLKLDQLRPFGYNPTILDDNGWLTMAYRWHHETGRPATAIALSQVDIDGSVVSNLRLPIDAPSAEDPFLFKVGNETFVSYVVARWQEDAGVWIKDPKCCVRYGRLANCNLLDIRQPEIGNNDWRHMEKNWVFFDCGGELAIIYECSPVHKVWFQNKWHESEGVKWPYGDARGGAIVDMGTFFLRFFHSRLDNDWLSGPHRYFLGAYEMEKEPPFKVIEVSRRPILYGSEIDRIPPSKRPTHWKRNIVFCNGCVVRDNKFILSLGVNDSQCELAMIGENQLNL